MLEVDVSGSLGAFSYNYRFSAEQGVTALWGVSGAGKSTLVNAIAGLVKPESGVIRYGEETWLDINANVDVAANLRKIGLVPQQNLLFPHMSVAGNLDYARKRCGRVPKVDAGAVADLLDISKLLSRFPGNLSGGERRRVAIGRAILSDPQLILLDEPFSGLDEERLKASAEYLKVLNAEVGVPIILVTHSIRDVLRMADNLVAINNGLVVNTGRPEVVFNKLDDVSGSDRVIVGEVLSYDPNYNLTTVDVEGCEISVAVSKMLPGRQVRILVNGRDVILSKQQTFETSAQNHIPCTVKTLVPVADKQVKVILGIGTQEICAEITQKAVDSLSLKPGKQCEAILKTTAISDGVFDHG